MCKEKGFLSVRSVGGSSPWASRPIPLSVCWGMGRSHDGENRSLHEKEAESGRVGAESTVCCKRVTPHCAWVQTVPFQVHMSPLAWPTSELSLLLNKDEK